MNFLSELFWDHRTSLPKSGVFSNCFTNFFGFFVPAIRWAAMDSGFCSYQLVSNFGYCFGYYAE